MKKKTNSRVYSRLDYHIIFGTKNCQKILNEYLLEAIRENAKKKIEELGGKLHILNGYLDHIHILLSLSAKVSISVAVKNIKGYTSHEIEDLYWQRGCGAFTVDKRSFENIFDYIKNQSKHHEEKSFEEEYEMLMRNKI